MSNTYHIQFVNALGISSEEIITAPSIPAALEAFANTPIGRFATVIAVNIKTAIMPTLAEFANALQSFHNVVSNYNIRLDTPKSIYSDEDKTITIFTNDILNIVITDIVKMYPSKAFQVMCDDGTSYLIKFYPWEVFNPFE